MRKVSRVVCTAFIAGDSIRESNTRTDGETLYLHNHPIARKFDDHRGQGLEVLLAGWGTPTTRDRINSLLRLLDCNVGFYQRKNEQFWSHPLGPDGIERRIEDTRDWHDVTGFIPTLKLAELFQVAPEHIGAAV